MDTRMLGRVAALLIRDLGTSRVIFIALTLGWELIVFFFITISMMVHGHGSRVDALSMRQKWTYGLMCVFLSQEFERTKHMSGNMVTGKPST
jgi:hypothetical protein